MIKNITIGVLAVLAVVAGTAYFLKPTATSLGAIAPSASYLPNYAIAVGKTTQNAFTLGSYAVATGTATFQVPFPRGLTYGFFAGDTCHVQLNTATATTGFSEDAFITSIASGNATVSVTFFNGSSTALNIATGTLVLACEHFGY